MDDCFKSTGEIIRQSREVQSFHAIDVEEKVDVVIRQDSVFSVEVEAGENIIDGITTEFTDGTLFISNENKCNWVRSYNHPMVVYVTVPELTTITQHGNGNIRSTGLLVMDTLDAEVWNSGNITLNVQSTQMYVRQHVSVGDVTLTGTVDNLYVYNNGNAFCRSQGLVAETAQVDSRGTGDTHVFVDNLLEYGITGRGNIYLYGAATASGTTTGAGNLIRQ